MTREEAIEVYNGLINTKIKEAFEFFAPELRKINEEEIRKDIIGGLMWQRDNLKSEGPHDNNLILPGFCLTVGEHLKYLEKQKEPEWNKKPCLTCQEYEKGHKQGYTEGCTAGYNKAMKEVEQKEQKPIIQDVELNDAVYDYVRDHFIAGADFTPEYIKKLIENAFFAGVDYYLLKQESESCESDTNVEKVIEDVIRVYGKTQGEWVGGYDVDTLIVNLRRAFNKNEQKPAEWGEEDEKKLELVIDCVYEFYPDPIMKYKLKDWLTQRLKSLRPQPHWRPSEQEKGALRTAIHILTEERNFPKAASHLQAILDAFDGKESRKDWKPSEEQMEALDKAIPVCLGVAGPDEIAPLESLYEQLKKLM